ncbi:hypothetical protein PG996_007266 [Apiospora saccharicola]|uniref:Uncharacterized protein n=1 Tax=Apiospora saccharicola TaxID=335842 RepID=A0ABR1VAC3_9PEZI
MAEKARRLPLSPQHQPPSQNQTKPKTDLPAVNGIGRQPPPPQPAPQPKQQPQLQPKQLALKPVFPLNRTPAPYAPVAAPKAAPKPLSPQQPRHLGNNPRPAAAHVPLVKPALQQQSPRAPQISSKPLRAAPAPHRPAPAAVLPSVLGRDLGDNTRTYIPAVKEEKPSGRNNNIKQVAPVPQPKPTVLGRDLGDNTRTYLPGVYKDGVVEYEADVDADKTHRSGSR